jgi:LmbE family N-acetylglucosaminyl deacetylase
VKVLISPHNDDETLFAAFTLLREKPLVIICTDGWIQWERGDPVTWTERREESRKASKILGVEVVFLGIRDTRLTEQALEAALQPYVTHEQAYAPALQGGNAQHDLVSRVAQRLYPNLTQYMTYTPTELWTKGSKEIVPTPEELALKNEALSCYRSQINLSSTRPHFVAVAGKSEWYL